LEIIDANGKQVRSKISLENSYTPQSVSVTNVNTPASKTEQE